MTKILFWMTTILLCLSFSKGYGQVSGQVTDDDGLGISDASVKVKDTDTETFTDADGNYTIDAEIGDVLVVESSTFPAREITVEDTVMNVGLTNANELAEAVFVGSRRKGRSTLNSAVPVDVIDITELTQTSPQVNVNQILNYVAPSFNSNTQTISDGTDHIDPASLRGLGPDQVLVLINGKRRHTSSLINVNGTFGRGQVGTDLNAIPTAAIQRIEILRDGAAAQYGSDAIAGVINIVLKESEGLTLNVTQGGFVSAESNGQTGGMDGETVNVAASLGFKLNDNGGFINLSGDFDYREPTNRMREFEGSIFNGYNSIEWVAAQSGVNDLSNLTLADLQFYAQGVTHFDLATKNAIANATDIAGLQTLLNFDTTDAELAARGQSRSDYNMRVGQSGLRSGRFMANLSLPLDNGAELYAFGGLTTRRGNSAGFYRLPNQARTYTPLYLNGFLPEINSNINDKSISAGIRGEYMGWDIDLSNTWGQNQFLFEIGNTSNASLLSNSPTTFDAGGHAFTQNTTNLDFTRFYDDILAGLNVAFGAEYRNEVYDIIAGEEASYTQYDADGNPVTTGTTASTDFFGNARPGGSQVFPGFSDLNELTRQRNSFAAYLDFDGDITEKWNVGVAGRFETYSDFGETFNWKVSSFYRLTDQINVRAAASTGFRAPSLHQLSYSNVSTIFDDFGNAVEVGVFSNDSQAAQVVGIPELKQEESYSISAGVTANIKSANLTLTADAYFIAIDDRVVLTGQFGGCDPTGNTACQSLQTNLQSVGAERAAFFANAIDTETKGLDIVANQRAKIGSQITLNNELAATFTQTQRVDEINASETIIQAGEVGTYFDDISRIYLEESVPRTKIRLAHTLNYGKFTGFLSNNYFGKVREANNVPANQQEFDGKIVTNLTLGYDLFKNFNITVGANNLFDVYPDRAIEANRSSGRFDWSRRAPQVGIGGRFLFARFILNLK